VPDGTARRNRLGTVRVRTTVAAALVVGVALVVGAMGLLGVLRQSMEDNVESAARLRADDVTLLLESGQPPEDLAVEEDADGDQETTFVQVVDANGQVLTSSSNIRGRPAVAQLRSGQSRRVDGLPLAPEDPYLVVAEGTERPDGAPLTVLVARALEPVDETISRVIRLLAAGLPLLVALVALTTWLAVGRALRPVAAIAAEVGSVTDAELGRRVPEPKNDDEISRLARTMNAMLARLQGSRDRQRQFVSDASHELRSPIATIRHELEVALAHPGSTDVNRLAADLLAEDLRMQRVVEDLLLLARTDEGDDPGEHRPVDLDDLALAEARSVRSEGRVQVDTSGVQAARVMADPHQLGRVVRNLVENARRHARGLVRIAVGVEGSDAVLRVDDDGPGVPEEDRDRVFERFTRLDDSRTRSSGGAGLGLAIAAGVIARHGGTIECLTSAEGGARFEVRLPVAGDAA
jgi:signal transduction histidine kinase